MKPRIGDVVEVVWLDSERINLGWSRVKAYMKAAGHPESYRTAGYWLGEVNGQAVVALSMDPGNGNVTECMSIPTVAIRSLQVVGRSNKRVRQAFA